jgi:hypothetical protein
VGGEVASRSIRLDINRKLAKLGMPYLWDPSHSTAQLEDVVTKDPGQFQLFARLPLMLSSAAFSLGAVLYAKPVRGGGHVCVGEPNGVAELSRRIDGRCLGAVPGGGGAWGCAGRWCGSWRGRSSRRSRARASWPTAS